MSGKESMMPPVIDPARLAELDILQLIGLLEYRIELLRSAKNTVRIKNSFISELYEDIEAIQSELRTRNI